MPKTALIIEDDEALGKLLATLCSKLEVEATVVRNGKEGFEKAKTDSPDLLVLDLLVPGMDGFKIAEALKAAAQMPKLVAVSGVYKDPKIAKEFADKYGADFFQKPFKNDEVSAAIARQLGLAAAPKPAAAPARVTGEQPAVQIGPMQGELQTKPFPSLVMELFRAKASGTLDLTQGQVRKRIFFNRGMIRFAQSNLKGENIGGMQVAEGIITEAQFQAAVAKARAERIGIGEALTVSGTLPYQALDKAIRRQVEEVSATAFAWQTGSFQFTPGNTDQIQDGRQDPIAVLLTGFKRYVTPERARGLLVTMGKGTVARGAEFDRALFVVRSVFSGETLTPMVNGRLKIEEILGRIRNDDLPLLLALVQLELATVTGLDAAALRPAVATATAAPARAYTAEERSAREMITAEHQRVMSCADHFSVLRLKRGASPDEAKAAYLPLAKRFHADAFSGMELGDAHDKLREMFAKISEAHSTLTDPRKRADYDVLLERQAAGMPTDMEVIFKAEGAFNRADALMKQGRFSDAEKAVREALKLDASVAQYHVALGQALLKGRGVSAAREAREALDKALAMNPDFIDAKIAKASALEMEGDVKGAQSLLREVLAVQPENVEAANALRNAKDAAKKGENKGLLGKLFKR